MTALLQLAAGLASAVTIGSLLILLGVWLHDRCDPRPQTRTVVSRRRRRARGRQRTALEARDPTGT